MSGASNRVVGFLANSSKFPLVMNSVTISCCGELTFFQVKPFFQAKFEEFGLK